MVTISCHRDLVSVHPWCAPLPWRGDEHGHRGGGSRDGEVRHSGGPGPRLHRGGGGGPAGPDGTEGPGHRRTRVDRLLRRARGTVLGGPDPAAGDGTQERAAAPG